MAKKGREMFDFQRRPRIRNYQFLRLKRGDDEEKQWGLVSWCAYKSTMLNGAHYAHCSLGTEDFYKQQFPFGVESRNLGFPIFADSSIVSPLRILSSM